jgi:hypothetical protein
MRKTESELAEEADALKSELDKRKAVIVGKCRVCPPKLDVSPVKWERWLCVPHPDVVGKCIVAWFVRVNGQQMPVRLEQFPRIRIIDTSPIEVEHDLPLLGVVAFLELDEGRRYYMAFNKVVEDAATQNNAL